MKKINLVLLLMLSIGIIAACKNRERTLRKKYGDYTFANPSATKAATLQWNREDFAATYRHTDAGKK